ncbi:GNAT family N-acetyltransferase [Phycicoccus sp. BSK3Z-2]|uniref:GNAT family N-acetyltransferase n=1 Tax=Phycicoccus avicenniae TaxID=2828860 RepID=A0A941D5T2_9MICO|nr:GNAT family N-acetyltransferase [Phycicoccus avicenniae]MBR7741678.1 GNAT family N-acetyltransferase [Phycicoccus avicenniae]
MTVVVRPVQPDELEAVGALTVEAYAADGRITPDHPYAATLRDAAARDRDAVLLVAADGDDVVGTVTYVPPGSSFAEVAVPGEAEVRTLAVDPRARGAGVGRLLSEECVRRARADGCPALVLSSGTWMTSAHRLYERLGFTRDPALDWTPRDGVDLLGFRLAL